VSIVTKIFVVLTTILALVIVPLMIAYVHNTAGIKGELEDVEQRRAVAVKEAQIINAQMAQTQNQVARAVEEADQARQRRLNEIDDLMTQITSKQQQITDLQNSLDQRNAQINTLVAGNEQSGKIIQMLEEELGEKRDRLVKADRQNIELTDKNQELRVKVDTMNEQVRLLQEKLAGTREQLVEIEQQRRHGVSGDDETRPVPAVRPIRGMITNVREVDGETFVAVNVGSNDQVAEGMLFIIHKADQYVGSLKITNVDLNSSAGRVTLTRGSVRPDLEVMASDF
jgi:predicted RNase H-like nuclease (RuvC/YqgF family)